jgi:hypothetical protein
MEQRITKITIKSAIYLANMPAVSPAKMPAEKAMNDMFRWLVMKKRLQSSAQEVASKILSEILSN